VPAELAVPTRVVPVAAGNDFAASASPVRRALPSAESGGGPGARSSGFHATSRTSVALRTRTASPHVGPTSGCATSQIPSSLVKAIAWAPGATTGPIAASV
jgi:hypothetical protein